MRALTLARPNKTPASQAIIDPNSIIFLLFEPLNKMSVQGIYQLYQYKKWNETHVRENEPLVSNLSFYSRKRSCAKYLLQMILKGS